MICVYLFLSISIIAFAKGSVQLTPLVNHIHACVCYVCTVCALKINLAYKRNIPFFTALNSVNGTKKLIGTKMINLMKLHNDLSFWLEIERYRDMADSIIASKNNGTYYPEDDYILHRKAHAIVNSYVDSTVHPRIQVGNLLLEIPYYL